MFKPPEPGDVNVRMADCINGDIAFPGEGAQFAFQGAQRFLRRGVKAFFIPVDRGKNMLQSPDQYKLVRIGVLQIMERFRHRPGQVIQFIRGLMQIAHVRPLKAMKKFPLRAASLQTGPEKKSQFNSPICKAFKIYVVMKGVNALIGLTIHVKQGFKPGQQRAAGFAEVEQSIGLISVAMLWKPHFFSNP